MKKEDILKLFPIETDRLCLRSALQSDVELIQSAKENCDQDVLRRWMSWSSEEGLSLQGTIDYLIHATTDERTISLLGVDKITGQHILSTGLDAEDDDFNVISTGWWLSKGYEGKGLAYEGMKSLLDLCRQNKVGQKIISCHYTGNLRSQNLMKRLGFHYAGTKEKAHQCHLNGEWMDVIEYEMMI